MSERLVILLHGVGSTGSDIAGLIPGLETALPGARFAAPNAPGRFNDGYQWFSIVGVTADNRAARIVAARPAFDAIIGEIIAREGFGDRLDRVALVGFSQGAIMALDALASGGWPVGAVVAFSGRLASPEPLAPAADGQVLIVHGGADPMMPASEAETAAARLGDAGVRVQKLIEPGLGHSISSTGVEAAAQFLARQ